jgi:hypothetical protein
VVAWSTLDLQCNLTAALSRSVRLSSPLSGAFSTLMTSFIGNRPEHPLQLDTRLTAAAQVRSQTTNERTMATRIMRCMKHTNIYTMRRAPQLVSAARLLHIVETASMRAEVGSSLHSEDSVIQTLLSDSLTHRSEYAHLLDHER